MDKKTLARIKQQMLDEEKEYLNSLPKQTLEQVEQHILAKEKEYLNSPFKKRIQIGISSFKTHWNVREYYKRGWMFHTLKNIIKLLLKKPFL